MPPESPAALPGLEILAVPSRAAAARLLESAGLPAADLTDALLQDFFYIGPDSGPTGLVGLEPHGEDGLLRSLVVAPALRAQGAGSALVQHAERHAQSRGLRALYLLTTTAEDFFARRGYARIARDAAPAPIRATREFAEFCPSSSACMVKRL